MSKITAFILLGLFTICKINAQEQSNNIGEKLPGFVLTNDGEKLEGFIRRKGKIGSQKTIKFFKNKEDKKPTKYSPKDLQAYQIANDYYKSIPHEGLSGKTKVFIHRFDEGKIELYEYFMYVTEDIDEVSLSQKGNTEVSLDIDGKRLSTEMIAVKDTGDVLKFSSPKMLMGFKKVMSNYVKDYSELATKIKNKEKGYGMLKVLQIVEEYNAHFAN